LSRSQIRIKHYGSESSAVIEPPTPSEGQRSWTAFLSLPLEAAVDKVMPNAPFDTGLFLAFKGALNRECARLKRPQTATWSLHSRFRPQRNSFHLLGLCTRPTFADDRGAARICVRSTCRRSSDSSTQQTTSCGGSRCWSALCCCSGAPSTFEKSASAPSGRKSSHYKVVDLRASPAERTGLSVFAMPNEHAG
jgi:hypothetical protein